MTATKTKTLIGWYTDGQHTRRVEAEMELRGDTDAPTFAATYTAGRAYKTGEHRGEWRTDTYGEPMDYGGGAGTDEIARVTRFAPGWNAERRDRLVSIMERWHLNDMRAGCEHQRAEGWDKRRIDPSKPSNAYGRHFTGQRQDSWNLLGWVRPDEHPAGLLTKPCPVCGYRYGTEWKTEDLPGDVIAFVRGIIA